MTDRSEQLILSVDVGTQSIRALAYDHLGDVAYKHKIEIEPYFSTNPGWAEQHADLYWDRLCDATKIVAAEIASGHRHIAALSVTTQRGTTVNVDVNGNPLRPAVTWLDQRLAPDLPKMPPHWRLLLSLAGQSQVVHRFRQHVDSNWQRANEPDIWARTHKVLLLSGFLTHRLTGSFVDTTAAQVGYIPFDYKRQKWARRGDWKWSATGMARRHLPTLKKPTERLGTLTPAAAKATGLPTGLPVIAAAADKACEIIGSGCVSPDTGSISLGTTATMNVPNNRYVEAIPHMPAYPGAIPDSFCTEIQIFRGFWMVRWFLEQFGTDEIRQANELGVAPEVLCDDHLNATPPGAMGLMVQPYWTPGVIFPSPESKGSIIGFGDVHTKAHVYRAIIEGLAFSMRDAKERIEGRTKTPVTTLRISGGGSQSDAVAQITADVMGMPVERPKTFETSGLGAAMIAAAGIGWYRSVRDAAEAMSAVDDIFVPSPTHGTTYDALYTNVYQKMQDHLPPLYRAVAKATGYPQT